MFNQKRPSAHEVTQATSLLNAHEASSIVEATMGYPVDAFVVATTSHAINKVQ